MKQVLTKRVVHQEKTENNCNNSDTLNSGVSCNVSVFKGWQVVTGLFGVTVCNTLN